MPVGCHIFDDHFLVALPDFAANDGWGCRVEWLSVVVV